MLFERAACHYGIAKFNVGMEMGLQDAGRLYIPYFFLFLHNVATSMPRMRADSSKV